MATYNKFQDFTEQNAKGVHQFGTHVYKIALSNTAILGTETGLAGITQVANGNGYTTGGEITTITVAEAAGTTTVSGTQVTWTGASAGFTFRYLVLYNDTATSPADALVGWWDHGSAVTVNASDVIVFKPNNASPGSIFTLV